MQRSSSDERAPCDRPVVRIARLSDVDERAERRAYWATRSMAERLVELEALRRMWPELTGDPDAPIERIVHKRRLGEPAPAPPRRTMSGTRR